MTSEPTDNRQQFVRRVWIVTSIVALIALIIALILTTFNVLLLILAGALIAIFFRGLSGLIQRKLHMPEKWSLPLAVIVTLLLLAGFFTLAGSKISQQVTELSQTIPSGIDKLKQELNKSSLGQQVLDRLSSKRSTEKAVSVIQSFFRSTFGVLGDIYVVLLLGLFFTAAPAIYRNGILKLVPPNAKPQARELTNELADSLKKWLKGKLFAMLVVAVLTLIGLLIIGVPMAFVLALIAGILNFIPNFGPLIAMIPAVLIGLMQSPVTAALVAGLYILVQVLESNVITPQIQKKLINIPPALIIIAQLFMGVLTGGWGLVLATPLVLILMVIVDRLYVKKMPDHE